MEKKYLSRFFEAMLVHLTDKKIVIQLTKVPDGWEGEMVRSITLFRPPEEKRSVWLFTDYYYPCSISQEGERAIRTSLKRLDLEFLRKLIAIGKVRLIFDGVDEDVKNRFQIRVTEEAEVK